MTVPSYDQYCKAIIYNRKACSALASVVNLALGRITKELALDNKYSSSFCCDDDETKFFNVDASSASANGAGRSASARRRRGSATRPARSP